MSSVRDKKCSEDTWRQIGMARAEQAAVDKHKLQDRPIWTPRPGMQR